MEGQFIPFIPKNVSRVMPPVTPPNLSVPTSSTNPSGFRSVTQNPQAAGAPACASAGEPAITLQREGDRVTHIRIQCACGQVIELACLY
jgi:hypothetical protein